MNKSQLIEQVAERLEMSRKEAADVVEAVIQAITESVAKGERVAISGFGIFEQVFRAARIGRNPRTGETVKIGAVTMPKFRPGTDFKNIVAGARDMTQRVTGGGSDNAEAAASKAAGAAKKTTTAKKTTAKKSTAKKSTAKKAPAKSTTAKKSTAKKTTAKKTTTAKKSTAAKKTTTKKASARPTSS